MNTKEKLHLVDNYLVKIKKDYVDLDAVDRDTVYPIHETDEVLPAFRSIFPEVPIERSAVDQMRRYAYQFSDDLRHKIEQKAQAEDQEERNELLYNTTVFNGDQLVELMVEALKRAKDRKII